MYRLYYVSQRRALCISGAWWCPRNAACLTDGAWIPAPHRTVGIGGMVLGGLPPPGHHTDSRPRHTPPVFLWRRPLACLGALDWEVGFRFGLYLVAYKAALKEDRLRLLSWHSTSSLLQLTGISRKDLIHSSRAPIFVIDAQGTPPDCLDLVASGAYTCSPSGLHIYSYNFKKAAA